ncbi:MAG: L,D-transpeptidase, partial [Prevotella sp.]
GKMKSSSPTLDGRRLIRSLSVDPQIPIFITYYTLYLNEEGELEEFRDVYGYDKVVYQYLAAYR